MILLITPSSNGANLKCPLPYGAILVNFLFIHTRCLSPGWLSFRTQSSPSLWSLLNDSRLNYLIPLLSFCKSFSIILLYIMIIIYILLLGRKVMTNLDSILKSRNITLQNKGPSSQGYGFSVVMYGCESWTMKKAEHQRIDAFELWCCRRSSESLGLQGDPTSPFWRRSSLGVLWKEWC